MIKKILENKGLVQFAIRTVLFLGIAAGIFFFIFLYFRHTPFFQQYLSLSESFYIPFLSGLRKRDMLNAVLFVVIMFIVWNRKEITKLIPYKQKTVQTSIFAALSILSLVGHYALKYLLNVHGIESNLFWVMLKNAFNVGFIVFLAYAVYNTTFIHQQIVKYKKQILPFIGVAALYFFIIQGFQIIWRYLGNFVARTLHFLLDLTFNNVTLGIREEKAPILGVGDFIVAISEECSGIDSLLLFISLMSVLIILDWKRMHKKRMLILLGIGLVGTIGYNLLRIYLLMLVGIFISPQFAIDTFHTNIGWMLFLVFFIVFWHFGSKWVYMSKKK